MPSSQVATICTSHTDCSEHANNVLQLQVTNPLYLWQLWRADARFARRCPAQHNAMMDDKVAALMKQPPPDYTIAGNGPVQGWVLC